jgi:uncharacterized membrane protein YkvA (DUF1232 family)
MARRSALLGPAAVVAAAAVYAALWLAERPAGQPTARFLGELVLDRVPAFLEEPRSERDRERATYEEVEQSEADLERVRAWLANIDRRDYFGAPRRAEAHGAVERCARALDASEAEAFARDAQPAGKRPRLPATEGTARRSLSYLVLLAALLLARPKGNRLGEALRLLPDVLRLLRRLASDSDVLRTARVRLWLLLADLAIPFDLVPDFVPVLGYADDAIIVSLVLRSVVRRTGAPVIRRLWPGTKDELAALCLTGFPSVSRCRARRESRRLRRRRGRGRRRRDRAHRCSCFRQGRKHAIRIGPSRCAPVAASSIAITRLEILTRQLESPSRDLGRGTSRQQARGGGPRGRRAGPAC